MRGSDVLAWILLISLAVYGCAQIIRRLCLWATRCHRTAMCCRVAVPKPGTALAPLMRCLQSQTAWDDPVGCRYTLLVLPDARCSELTELNGVLPDTPLVLPIVAEDLPQLLNLLTQECKRKE